MSPSVRPTTGLIATVTSLGGRDVITVYSSHLPRSILFHPNSPWTWTAKDAIEWLDKLGGYRSPKMQTLAYYSRQINKLKDDPVFYGLLANLPKPVFLVGLDDTWVCSGCGEVVGGINPSRFYGGREVLFPRETGFDQAFWLIGTR